MIRSSCGLMDGWMDQSMHGSIDGSRNILMIDFTNLCHFDGHTDGWIDGYIDG